MHEAPAQWKLPLNPMIVSSAVRGAAMPTNQLIATMAQADRSFILQHAKRVCLNVGSRLSQANQLPNYVYFPLTTVISRSNQLIDGTACQVAVVGNEGFTGVGGILGGESSVSQTTVSVAGLAYRLQAPLLLTRFECSANLRRQLLGYALKLMNQISNSATCNRHHSIDQQLCRWLLTTLDHIPSNQIAMTHELLAHTHGIRRESISAAAFKLQKAGAISYSRGHIKVVERKMLESRACECYESLKYTHAAMPTGSKPAARSGTGASSASVFYDPPSSQHATVASFIRQL